MMSEQGAILSAEELAEIESSTFFEREAPWELVDGEHTGPLGKQIAALLVSHAALAAQFATAQATIVRLRTLLYGPPGESERGYSDLAQERERRIASEGREGELRKALEAIENVGMGEAGITRTTTMASAWECQKIARDALATPDTNNTEVVR